MYKESEGIPKGYNRVTEIFSPYKDFSAFPEAILETAARRGSLVHGLCESYALETCIDQPTKEVKPYFDSFKNWFDEYVSKVIITELRVTSDKLFLSGQLDLLCTLKGSEKIVLVDYKTPKNADRSWQLQTAAYSYLLKTEKNIIVDRRIALMLSAEGKEPRILEYTDHENDEKLFLNQLSLFRFFNPFIR